MQEDQKIEDQIAALRAKREEVNQRILSDRAEAKRLSEEIRQLEGPIPRKRNRRTQFRLEKVK